MNAAALWMAGAILGLIISFAGIIKLVVIGYYPNEYLPTLLLVLAGLAIAVSCHVMHRRTKEDT
ncbi:hypothetical protein CH252_06840 [Rhodococcus sp. 06-1477-1B]|nr:hypothetical protein CH252_06840 [Rhodococcus sp. 06-1477-1B]